MLSAGFALLVAWRWSSPTGVVSRANVMSAGYLGGGIRAASSAHNPAFQSRLIFLARLHLWTSVGPS